MDDVNDSLGDSWDNLSWFAYGYYCAEEDVRNPPDPKDKAFGYLAVVVFVVCGVLWALTDSIAFAVICGLIGLAGVWKLCYGSRAKKEDEENYRIVKFKWGERRKRVPKK